MVSQFNGTSTPKGSYSAKTGDSDCFRVQDATGLQQGHMSKYTTSWLRVRSRYSLTPGVLPEIGCHCHGGRPDQTVLHDDCMQAAVSRFVGNQSDPVVALVCPIQILADPVNG